MKFRRAKTLVMYYYSNELGIHNFVTKSRFTCSSEALELLSKLEEWHTEEQIFEYFPRADRRSLADQIAGLVEFDAVVVEGSQQAAIDQEFRDTWQWGIVGGFYHFATRNTPLLPEPDQLELVRRRVEAGQTPPRLHETNAGASNLVRLPTIGDASSLLQVMRSRRSDTHFLDGEISLAALGECLYAGNGITAFRQDEGFGEVPVKMAPSLDSRNPYELYVYANRVCDLSQGFYHYGAADHDLACVRPGQADASSMCGGQSWAADAAAIIILVARFTRTGWRHHLAMTYRNVVVEAGFIGQNIALMGAAQGLSAVPIGSFKHDLVERQLGTPAIDSSVMLMIAIGKTEDTRASKSA